MSLTQLFSEPEFEVELDPDIQDNLKPQYQQLDHVRLPIRLFDLLKNLGSVQPRRKNPSFLKSLIDYGYLLERLYNTPELKVKIQETREQMGSETLQEVSELMGIGLSVTVVSKLFDVQQSTIQKIIGVSSTRPDWKCNLKTGESLLVEAKGSSNRDTSKRQLAHALGQKQAQNGDVKIATATILNETIASSMKIKDPTIFPDNNDHMKQHVERAYHYASVFSFLGDDVLCLYFEKMAKRLSGDIKNLEMNDKQNMFDILSYNTPFVKIENKNFSGHLYCIQTDQFHNQFLYVGVDIRLLSYQSFLDYKERDDEIRLTKNNNHYFIHTDGIMIVNVLNPESFMDENQIKSIGVSMDQIALSDIDSIRSNSFKRYVKYLLEKCFENVTWTEYGSLKVVNYDNKTIEYIIYHTRNIKYSEQQRDKILSFMKGRHGILVTNLMIPKELFHFKCVNRDDFAYISETKANSNSVSKVFCY